MIETIPAPVDRARRRARKGPGRCPALSPTSVASENEVDKRSVSTVRMSTAIQLPEEVLMPARVAKRRGNGEGTIFRRDSLGTWCAVLTVDGRRKYLYAKTRQEVARKLSAAIEARDRGVLITAPQQPLGKYLDQWLQESVKPRVRPWTYKGYEVLIRRHIKPVMGKVPLQKLTPLHVQRLLNRMVAGGASPKTASYALGTLRTALNEAMRWGLISRNVAALVPRPRVDRFEIQPLSPAEARHFLEIAAEGRLGALYSVALTMGLRQGEALGLRWQDVDLDAGLLHVRFQLQRIDGHGLVLVAPKTKLSRRTLALPPTVVANLRSHKAQAQERLQAGPMWHETALVFTTPIGTGLDGPNVTKAFQRLLKKAGLPHRRFHDLRHSCASLLLAQNVAPRVVMEVLGHSQISLTMNTYSHVLPELKREAAAQMEALISDRTV
jgi:integrase